MIHIAVVTGTRAEYGILKPVIDEIDFSPHFKLSLIVTGMHLAPEFGLTVRQIENDGLSIAGKVDMLLSSDTAPAMGKGLGIGIYGLSHEFERLKPDIVLVLGDRVEAFAGATAGLFCGAAIAHIHGGELTRGGLDEYMRHAITKLSHLHFAATEKSQERIINMGEHPDYVYCTGTPGLDDLMRFPKWSDEELAEKTGMDIPERYVLAVQHPVSTHPETAPFDVQETLTALKNIGLPVFMSYPNADAGSRELIATIRKYEEESWLTTFVSLSRVAYSNLLRCAAVLVGNTSSGVIDSPAYGVPVVNIGERQEGRERGDNVIDVSYDAGKIEQAIQRALTDEIFIEQAKSTKNPYGEGQASQRIRAVLETVDLQLARRMKRLPW